MNNIKKLDKNRKIGDPVRFSLVSQVAELKPKLSKQFWGLHFWARGYFVASYGNLTDDVIAQYIEMQTVKERDRDDDITID